MTTGIETPAKPVRVQRRHVEPDYDAEMRLPSGKTCDNCRHAKRCFAFGFSETGRTSCDFWPNHFEEIAR